MSVHSSSTRNRSASGVRLAVVGVAVSALGASALTPVATAAGAKKRPDLVVTKIGSPTSAAPGETFRVATTVRNKGRLAAKKSKLVVVLSLDRRKSRSDTRVGRASIKALNPRKKTSGRVKVTIPTDATGSYFLIACAAGVKRESRKAGRNNCRTAARPLDVVGADPSFPERFVGTASSTYTEDIESTPTDSGFTYSYTGTTTLTSEAVYTRVETDSGGFAYVSTGSIEYTLRQSDQGGDDSYSESCTTTAEGDTAIGPFRTHRGASGSLVPGAQGGSFAPGQPYRMFSAWDFAGLGSGTTTRLPNRTECTGFGGDGPTSNGYDGTFDLSTGWIPPAGYACDNYPTPRLHNVRSDGSLVGSERCTTRTVTDRSNGSTETRDIAAEWSWSFEPTGR